MNRYNREYTMTKISGTHIRNINEACIDVFVGIPLEYIVCYHHALLIRGEKRTKHITITNDTVCIPLVYQ